MEITFKGGEVHFKPGNKEIKPYGEESISVSINVLKAEIALRFGHKRDTQYDIREVESYLDKEFAVRVGDFDCIEWVDDIKEYKKDYKDVLKFIYYLAQGMFA